MDYKSGKYSAPSGEYVFGTPRIKDVLSPAGDENLDSPLDYRHQQSLGNGRHTKGGPARADGGGGASQSTIAIEAPSKLPDNIADSVEAQEVVWRIIAGLIMHLLNGYAKRDPDAVEAFDRLYLGPNFPGAELIRFSRRDEAEWMGISKDTIKTRADRIRVRMQFDQFGDYICPERPERKPLNRSIEGNGGRTPFTALPIKLGKECHIEGRMNHRPDAKVTVKDKGGIKRSVACTFGGEVTIGHTEPIRTEFWSPVRGRGVRSPEKYTPRAYVLSGGRQNTSAHDRAEVKSNLGTFTPEWAEDALRRA